jgi:hypothetical protein
VHDVPLTDKICLHRQARRHQGFRVPGAANWRNAFASCADVKHGHAAQFQTSFSVGVPDEGRTYPHPVIETAPHKLEDGLQRRTCATTISPRELT